MNPSFAGVWRLVSYERTEADGTVVYPFGRDAVGRIAYDESGRMSVQLMQQGRQAGAASAEGYIAYFGSYEVDEEAGKVTHHLVAALRPDWVGKDLVRYYEFSGDRLILTARAADSTSRITWERAAGSVS
jgi:hypothetical protein